MIDLELIKKAIALTQNGDIAQAEKIYSDLIAEYPEDAHLLSLYGLFNVSTGNYDKACKILIKACEINPTIGTVSAIGFAEFERKNYEKAAEWLEKSLVYGENQDILNKLILSLFEIKEYKKAVCFTEKMLEKYPDDIRSITNKIKALTYSGQLIEAEILCKNTLKQHPEVSSLWQHLGFLNELIYSDDRKAIECFKVASELGNFQAYYNIAVCHQKLREFDAAEKYYKKILANSPYNVDTLTSLGMCYLSQKKFKEGYDLFFRRDKSKLAKGHKNFWQVGDELDDEIVILCDQGFGDHIQFIRYLPLLKARKVYVAVNKSLKELFQMNYPECIFIDYEKVKPEMQLIMVTDLAYVLGINFDNIPFSEGYLDCAALDIKSEKTKIGLCWEAGSAGIRTMINRTINIKLFEPLLNKSDVQVYSFQVEDSFDGNNKYPQMINLAASFISFLDTAKALKAMDVVVTVDTSVAHLAGALGVKTFLLLPYATDWRWFDDNKTTPWYKSIRIFKQTDSISWELPINEVINNL